jgi:hypothetical protein
MSLIAFAIEVPQTGEPVNGHAMRIAPAFQKDLPEMLRQALPRALSFGAVRDRVDRQRPVER